jgi:hypothetical protein
MSFAASGLCRAEMQLLSTRDNNIAFASGKPVMMLNPEVVAKD